MKHVGKMKNNGAKIVVAYRTLPGDSGSALVVGTGTLPEAWHDSLMNLVQDVSGQQANELADLLSVRKFPDGSTMLEALHTRGFLKKVPTSGVIMTPTKNDTVLLSELNQLIAEQKGTTVDQLAITDGVNPNPPTRARNDPTRTTSSSINEDEQDLPKVQAEAPAEDLTPAQMRSKADALFKQAQILRKKADEVDPPKSKKKSLVVEA
jgi:hypothetical protein